MTGSKTAKQRDRHVATLLNKSFKKILSKNLDVPKKKKLNLSTKPIIKSNGNWEIQVGAFKTFTTAHKTATKAKKQISSINKKANIFIEPVVKESKTFYRAKIKTLSKIEAIRSCKKLKKSNFRCVYSQIKK